MDGIVVIGEGEKDEAPMLYNGERIGDGTAAGDRHRRRPDRRHHAAPRSAGGNALAVIAVSERGTMFDPGPCVYMEKIAVGPEAARRHRHHRLRHREPPGAWPRPRARRSATSPPSSSTAHRHDDLIAEVRAAGARIRLIPDGDVAGAISTAWPDSGADILFGIGGTPEGVIAAAALKCMGGDIQGRLWPRNDERAAGGRSTPATTSTRCSTTDDLVAGDNCFFAATGITDGELLKGVHYDSSRRHDPVAGDALEVRHGAPGQRPPPPQEAQGLQPHRVRLTRSARRRTPFPIYVGSLSLWRLLACPL